MHCVQYLCQWTSCHMFIDSSYRMRVWGMRTRDFTVPSPSRLSLPPSPLPSPPLALRPHSHPLSSMRLMPCFWFLVCFRIFFVILFGVSRPAYQFIRCQPLGVHVYSTFHYISSLRQIFGIPAALSYLIKFLQSVNAMSGLSIQPASSQVQKIMLAP